MRLEPKRPPEPHKRKTAVHAGLIMLAFFAPLLYQGDFAFSRPQPPAVLVSLVPDVPQPRAQPLPKPQPVEEKPEPPQPAPEEVQAAAEKEAEIIRQKKAEEERKKKEQARKQEEERKKKEAEQKRKKEKEAEEKKREEEKKRKEEEARKQREAEQERQRKAAAERAQQELIRGRMQRVANRITGLIVARINDYLRTPASVPASADIVTIVQVRLDRDGNLIGFPEILESSGYPEYDESAIRAVLQAAPLPMPRDAFILNNPTLMADFLEHRLAISPVE